MKAIRALRKKHELLSDIKLTGKGRRMPVILHEMEQRVQQEIRAAQERLHAQHESDGVPPSLNPEPMELAIAGANEPQSPGTAELALREAAESDEGTASADADQQFEEYWAQAIAEQEQEAKAADPAPPGGAAEK